MRVTTYYFTPEGVESGTSQERVATRPLSWALELGHTSARAACKNGLRFRVEITADADLGLSADGASRRVQKIPIWEARPMVAENPKLGFEERFLADIGDESATFPVSVGAWYPRPIIAAGI